MADRPARLQILPVDVELLRDAPPPEEVARELVARLSALPYVVDVQWSPEVVIEEEELGKDRFLHGRVTMLPAGAAARRRSGAEGLLRLLQASRHRRTERCRAPDREAAGGARRRRVRPDRPGEEDSCGSCRG